MVPEGSCRRTRTGDAAQAWCGLGKHQLVAAVLGVAAQGGELVRVLRGGDLQRPGIHGVDLGEPLADEVADGMGRNDAADETLDPGGLGPGRGGGRRFGLDGHLAAGVAGEGEGGPVGPGVGEEAADLGKSHRVGGAAELDRGEGLCGGGRRGWPRRQG